jgi:hypothetical protein
MERKISGGGGGRRAEMKRNVSSNSNRIQVSCSGLALGTEGSRTAYKVSWYTVQFVQIVQNQETLSYVYCTLLGFFFNNTYSLFQGLVKTYFGN